MTKVIKPIIKWVGGKTQILKEVLNKFPQKMNDYHEIFLGGGSVLLGVIELKKKGLLNINNIYAYDSNKYLINLYKCIQQNPEKLYNEIIKLVKIYNNCKELDGNKKPKNLEEAIKSKESYYYWIRNEFNKINKELDKEFNDIKINDKKINNKKINNKKINNKKINDKKINDKELKNKKLNIKEIENSLKNLELINKIEDYIYYKSALFVFINKTCFRGMYRTGPNGFNVPFGHYKKPTIIDKEHLFNISVLIKNVIFTKLDYTLSIKRIKKDDFAYLDPPYYPLNSKSFVKYNKDGFDLNNHLLLFKTCKELNAKKIKFVMSNSSSENVINKFNEDIYKITYIECKRRINSKKPNSKVNEIIIMNY